ncbi:MAG: hypothetical protein FJ279_13330 [Planctomycetes bacterium]|nr:hypothetical protein [Planctomycetota bacterium]
MDITHGFCALTCLLSLSLAAMASAQTPAERPAEWRVEPSFKCDLFNFLLSISPTSLPAQKDYGKEKALWRGRLDAQTLSELDRLTDFGQSRLSASRLSALFTFVEPASTADLVSALESPTLIEQSLAAYPKSAAYGDLPALHKNRQALLNVVTALQKAGYDDWWQGEIRPLVQKRCDEMREQLRPYPASRIADEVSKLLRMEVKLPGNALTIWVTYFYYALCYRLVDNSATLSFDAGKPLDVAASVSTMAHELLHNFDMSPELWDWHQRLMREDKLYAAGFDSVQRNFGQIPVESFVFAAECHLAEKLGIRTDKAAFEHLLRNYGGRLVLATILYDEMSRSAEVVEKDGYHAFILGLFKSGKIRPGAVKDLHSEVVIRRVGQERLNSMVVKWRMNDAAAGAESQLKAFQKAATPKQLAANLDQLDASLASLDLVLQRKSVATALPVGRRPFPLPASATGERRIYVRAAGNRMVEVYALTFDSPQAVRDFWARSVGEVRPQARESDVWVRGFSGEADQFISSACWVQGRSLICVYAPGRSDPVHMAEAAETVEQVVKVGVARGVRVWPQDSGVLNQHISEVKGAYKQYLTAFRQRTSEQQLMASLDRLDDRCARLELVLQQKSTATGLQVGTRAFPLPARSSGEYKSYLKDGTDCRVEVYVLKFDSEQAAREFWDKSIAEVQPRARGSDVFVIGLRGEPGHYISSACWTQGGTMVCIYVPTPWTLANLAEAAETVEQVVKAVCGQE